MEPSPGRAKRELAGSGASELLIEDVIGQSVAAAHNQVGYRRYAAAKARYRTWRALQGARQFELSWRLTIEWMRACLAVCPGASRSFPCLFAARTVSRCPSGMNPTAQQGALPDRSRKYPLIGFSDTARHGNAREAAEELGLGLGLGLGPMIPYHLDNDNDATFWALSQQSDVSLFHPQRHLND
ncbi:hypothetical protein NM208_g15864 [Fusarium decemcellulare]|uniref:Uncharacterized protein n=1 Tax=Fusarium decemcellulare TaxID=57161 RepID=A0ACC1RDN7_9HYPO|nr:hypothetical protein NM208_g15864 [Fusarium decemcellulare]